MKQETNTRSTTQVGTKINGVAGSVDVTLEELPLDELERVCGGRRYGNGGGGAGKVKFDDFD